ncbi:Ig-like domain-containing protein [Roseivivax marinus]|uniref:Ig-like domain-containing protein n=1 Tax=Roseivivax marinus TaxID=1379903 RepID=UPI00273DCAEE|nr:Ig-like domain-containing protein [Roseivivax marinus]
MNFKGNAMERAGTTVTAFDLFVAASQRTGDASGNYITGDDGPDSIAGLGGADTLYGRAGDDTIDGGTGNDLLFGQSGADSLIGGGGDDSIFGGAGNDTLEGRDGNDVLSDTLGDNLFRPGAGRDVVIGGSGTDTVEFSGSVFGYAISRPGGTGLAVVTDTDASNGDTGRTQVLSVERLVFSDVAIDLTANNAPVAAADSFTLAEDAGATVLRVADNDLDFDPSDTLSVVQVSGAAHGTAVASGATIVYTPDANYFGSDSLTYRLSDGTAQSSAVTVDITVTPVNDAPIAVEDTGTTIAEDGGSVQVMPLANDSDIENDPLTLLGLGTPLFGTATFSVSTVTYTPDPDAFGAETFTYRVGDGQGGVSTGTIRIDVTPVNDAPVAVDDAGQVTPEDTPLLIDVLANDTDPDPGPLSIASFVQPSTGTVSLSEGKLLFTPDKDFNGGPVTFSYTVRDEEGETDEGEVSVLVTPVNDAPEPLDGVAADVTVSEDDGTVKFDLNDKVVDIDGDPLSFSNVVVARDGTQAPISVSPDGSVVSFDATAFDLEEGETETFTIEYVVSDGDLMASGSFDVTVEGTDPPEPEPPTPTTTPSTVLSFTTSAAEADGTVSIPLSSLISDPDDVLKTVRSLSGAFPFALDPLQTQTRSVQFSRESGDLAEPAIVISLDQIGFELTEASLNDPGTPVPITFTYVISDSTDPFSDRVTGTFTLDYSYTADTTPPTILDSIAGALIVDAPDAPETVTFDLFDYVSVGGGAGDSTIEDVRVSEGPIFYVSTDENGDPVEIPISYVETGIGTADPDGIVTIAVADLPIEDGEQIVGKLEFTITDGVTSDSGIVSYTFEDSPEPVSSLVETFEGYSFSGKASAFISEFQGVNLSGIASVIETDELGLSEGDRGTSLTFAQVTPGGSNILSLRTNDPTPAAEPGRDGPTEPDTVPPSIDDYASFRTPGYSGSVPGAENVTYTFISRYDPENIPSPDSYLSSEASIFGDEIDTFAFYVSTDTGTFDLTIKPYGVEAFASAPYTPDMPPTEGQFASYYLRTTLLEDAMQVITLTAGEAPQRVEVTEDAYLYVLETEVGNRVLVDDVSIDFVTDAVLT